MRAIDRTLLSKMEISEDNRRLPTLQSISRQMIINNLHEAITWFVKWARSEGWDPEVIREVRKGGSVLAYVVRLEKEGEEGIAGLQKGDPEVKFYVVHFARVWFNSFERTCKQPAGTGIGITFHKVALETAIPIAADLGLVWIDGKIYGIPALSVMEYCAKYPGAVFSHEGNKGYQKDDHGVPVKMLQRLNPNFKQ